MSNPIGYSRLQIRLHWIIAALIVLQFLLHESIAQAWETFLEGGVIVFKPLIAIHVFGGLLVLLLALWRLAVRLNRGSPPPPEKEHPMLKMLANATHWIFYLLMIFMPVSGAVAWFGGVKAAANGHNVLKIALLVLVLLHVIAVLFHQFILKTNIMERMRRIS